MGQRREPESLMPDRETLLSLILDALPYPVVFVDTEHIIRYLNKPARDHYYAERGYPSLIGQSIFGCHAEPSSAQICELFQRVRTSGEETPLHPDARDDRSRITPVFDVQGELIGYFKTSGSLREDG